MKLHRFWTFVICLAISELSSGGDLDSAFKMPTRQVHNERDIIRNAIKRTVKSQHGSIQLTVDDRGEIHALPGAVHVALENTMENIVLQTPSSFIGISSVSEQNHEKLVLVVSGILILASILATTLCFCYPSPSNEVLARQTQSYFQQIPAPQKIQAMPPVRAVPYNSTGIEVLPPICTELIRAERETRFDVQMHSLLRLNQAEGEANRIDVCGSSGMKLLNGHVHNTPDGRRCLALSAVGCEDDPRTRILTSRGRTSDAFEILGTSGKFYGHLEFPSASLAELLWCGGGEPRSVLKIEKGSQSELFMEATTADGRFVASAGKRVIDEDSVDASTDLSPQWTVTVVASFDAVLILSCMLAVILLRPWLDIDEAVDMSDTASDHDSADVFEFQDDFLLAHGEEQG